MSSNLTLLVLAAGMGSRYGGLKQVDPMGPEGETLLDYSVFDAWRNGFSRVVFVIRREMHPSFAEHIGMRFSSRLAIDYVFQELDDLPSSVSGTGRSLQRSPAVKEEDPAASLIQEDHADQGNLLRAEFIKNRYKPWGTGQAIWAARHVIQEPFLAINADDFYGQDAFAQLANFLSEAQERPTHFAMAGYRLANTLSEHGTVARGICEVDADGTLLRIQEQTDISVESKSYSGQETVSMNFWGFTPMVFPLLEKHFVSFLRSNQEKPNAEFYIPEAVFQMISAGDATVQVLSTNASWFGVTYPEDKPRVVAALADLTRSGQYPSPLWKVEESES